MTDGADGRPVVDSPTGWVNKHIHEYLESGGEKGHDWRPGVPTLLLTTTGRKSGVRRRTALIYVVHGAEYLVIASNGGSHVPAWFLNLQADPEVQIQVGATVATATARVVDPAERAELWPAVTAVWPAYDEYQAKADRQIPIVAIAPR